MKKNLIVTAIILSVMLLVPFKVSAATCKTYTNWYLFHVILEEASWVSGEYPNLIQDCKSNGEICKWTNRTDTAYFINNIPEDAEIIDEDFTALLTSSGVNTMHKNWKYMLDNNIYYYKDGTDRYYRNNNNGDGFSYIFTEEFSGVTPGSYHYTNFMNSVLSSSLDKSDESNGLVYTTKYADYEEEGNNLKFTLKRNFEIPYELLMSCFDVGTYSSNGTNHACIIPSTYTIDYKICDDYDDEETTGTFTIKYDGNGGKTSGGKTTVSYSQTTGNTHKIKDNMFIREGYEFLGWNTNSTATTPDNDFYNVGTALLSSKTLYAIWEKVDDSEYTITYHKNDGTSDVKTSDNSKVIGENPFTRDGYKFVGWSTDKDATKADSNYEPGDTYDKKSNLDLYAVWVKEGTTGTTNQSKNGLGYSVGIIGAILVATGAGVVYFKRRNKFENI